MSTSLTPEILSSETAIGKDKLKKESEQEKRAEKRKQRVEDLKEAQERINEAEEQMTYAASRGRNEIQACVLRRGVHFKPEFDKKQLPRYLGTIGKKVYKYFRSKGFEIEFRQWSDAMHYDFESDYGYEVIVIW